MHVGYFGGNQLVFFAGTTFAYGLLFGWNGAESVRQEREGRGGGAQLHSLASVRRGGGTNSAWGCNSCYSAVHFFWTVRFPLDNSFLPMHARFFFVASVVSIGTNLRAVMQTRCKYSCWKCVSYKKDRQLGIDEEVM